MVEQTCTASLTNHFSPPRNVDGTVLPHVFARFCLMCSLGCLAFPWMPRICSKFPHLLCVHSRFGHLLPVCSFALCLLYVCSFARWPHAFAWLPRAFRLLLRVCSVSPHVFTRLPCFPLVASHLLHVSSFALRSLQVWSSAPGLLICSLMRSLGCLVRSVHCHVFARLCLTCSLGCLAFSWLPGVFARFCLTCSLGCLAFPWLPRICSKFTHLLCVHSGFGHLL